MAERMQVTTPSFIPPAEGRGGVTLASTWRKLWRWLRPLFGLGLLVFLLWRVDWQQLTRIVGQASVGYVGVALLIELLNVLPRVLRWRALLLTQGTGEPFLRLLSIYLVGSFFNNFLPSNVGGDSVRMLRMIQLTGRGADAASSVLVERLCGLFAVLLMGVVAVLSNWRLASAGGIGFLVLGAFVAFVLGMLLLFNLRRVRSWADRLLPPTSPDRGGLGRVFVVLIGKLGKLYDSIYAFRGHGRVLLVVLALSLLFRFGCVFGLYVQSFALHVSIPFIWLMMAISLIAVVTSLPLSLNAIGIQEGAYVFFLGLAGIAAPQALALALLSRGVRLAVSLVGGVIYLLGK
ncbi:MAG: lysylphosphatidylglycerol synthase transmembrane domain-containing protein [Anaerolineae bacterium]